MCGGGLDELLYMSALVVEKRRQQCALQKWSRDVVVLERVALRGRGYQAPTGKRAPGRSHQDLTRKVFIASVQVVNNKAWIESRSGR
jgi:phosphoribosylamine-glycine ligase